MADYDRRPRGGGRGPYNNYNNNNRKRRFRDDDYDDRRPQRRRYEEPLSVTLRKQVLSIAESPVRKTEDDVASIAKTIADNYFDTDLTTTFLDLVVKLTLEQPLKIPFVAAIVLLTNTQKPEFTTEVLKKVGEITQKHLNAGSWREVKLFLRFLGTLQGIFEGDGVFAILEELFSRAVDLQTESSEDSLGLELVKVILFTIPYTMASSATGFETQANTLLDKTDIIASTPHILENLVDPFPSTEAAGPTSSESALALMQKHMLEEARNGWELACLPRAWKITRADGDEDPLPLARKHAFPEIIVPEKVQMGPKSIYPEIYFSVYTEQDIETVPSATDVASLLIRDTLTDTINILDYNRTATAKFLIDLDCYFAPNTFVKRATAFDKLRDVAGDKATWKPEDVVVDAAFAQLFQLPAPEHKLVYYHSVLTEACKIAPAAIAPSLGRAIRSLYKNIDKMDVELAQRFLDWFAHHLSNFGFTWKWTEWVDDVEMSNVHPKKAFIVAALDKEIRLSFAQRIKGTLPEPYQALISPAKEKDMPDFKFNDESTPFAAEGREIAQLIRRKASDEEFASLIEAVEQAAASSGLPNPQAASTDVLMTAICWVGSKSLSHVLSCIERCKDRLLATSAASSSNRRQMISSVMEYWADHPGVGVNVLDKLLNYLILTPTSIVEWALIDRVDRGFSLSLAWIYELVASTVTKVTHRIRHLVATMRPPGGLPDDQLALLQPVLAKELEDMNALFSLIEDTLIPLRDASNDQMMEEDSDAFHEEEEPLIRMWAAKWIRVFRRRAAVEETWVREELAKPIPPAPVVRAQPQREDVKKEEAGQPAVNGSGGSNGFKMEDVVINNDGDAIE